MWGGLWAALPLQGPKIVGILRHRTWGGLGGPASSLVAAEVGPQPVFPRQ
jgi:hypothetical protein